MTTTVLESPSNPSSASAIAESPSQTDAAPTQAIARTPSTSSSAMNKLPYQKPQQVELLNLHAEAEALLQQLQQLKQQRLISMNHGSQAALNS